MRQLFELVEEGVNHDVAAIKEFVVGVALVLEIFETAGFGDKELIGDGVGGETVDFLGHGAVA